MAPVLLSLETACLATLPPTATAVRSGSPALPCRRSGRPVVAVRPVHDDLNTITERVVRELFVAGRHAAFLRRARCEDVPESVLVRKVVEHAISDYGEGRQGLAKRTCPIFGAN